MLPIAAVAVLGHMLVAFPDEGGVLGGGGVLAAVLVRVNVAADSPVTEAVTE